MTGAGSLQIWFVERRYAAIEEMLTLRGFMIATATGQPSRWDERPEGDPPTGLVHIRAYLRDEHNAPDRRVSFTATERWAARDPGFGATESQGHWRASYSYHARLESTVGCREFRYDFDPQQHPEMPYHAHPERAPNQRQLWTPVDPADAVDRLQQMAADETEKGNL